MEPVLLSVRLSEIVPRRKSLVSLIPSLADNFFSFLGSDIIIAYNNVSFFRKSKRVRAG